MSVCLRNLAVLLGALGLVSASLAQQPAEPSAVDTARGALQQARTEYADANAAVSRAEVARMKLEKSVRAEFSARPDLADARRYLSEVTLYYNALRKAVRDEFANDPFYLAIRADIEQAERALHAARQDDSTPLAHTLKLMHALMRSRSELTRYEAAAFALDPAIEDARLEMARAYEYASRLERGYQAQAGNDPRLKAADAEIAHAKERVVAARRSLIAADQKLETAERAEAQQKARRRTDPPPIRRQDP